MTWRQENSEEMHFAFAFFVFTETAVFCVLLNRAKSYGQLQQLWRAMEYTSNHGYSNVKPNIKKKYNSYL